MNPYPADTHCLTIVSHTSTQLTVVIQKQLNTPLKADHPERPTITLGWSFEHPPGIIMHEVLLFDFMVSRSGWHRNRGVFICSQSVLTRRKKLCAVHMCSI